MLFIGLHHSTAGSVDFYLFAAPNLMSAQRLAAGLDVAIIADVETVLIEQFRGIALLCVPD